MLSISFEVLLKDRFSSFEASNLGYSIRGRGVFFAKLPEADLRPARALSAQPLVDLFFLPKDTTDLQSIQNAIDGAKNRVSRVVASESR